MNYFSTRIFSYVNNTSPTILKINKEIELCKIDEKSATLKENGNFYYFNVEECVCTCSEGIEGHPCDHSSFLASNDFFVKNETCEHLYEVKKTLFHVSRGFECDDIDYYAGLRSDGKCPNAKNISVKSNFLY